MQAEPLVLLPCASGGGGAGQSASEVRAAPCPAWRCRPGADAATCVVARGRTPVRPSLPPAGGRPGGWREAPVLAGCRPVSISVGMLRAGRAWTALPWLPCRASAGGLGACVARPAAPCSASRGGGSFDHSREFEFVRSFLRVWLLSRAPAAPGPGRAPRDARGDGNTLKISLETQRRTLSDFRPGDVPTWSGAERACVRGHLWGWGRGSTLVSEKGTLFQRRQLQG